MEVEILHVGILHEAGIDVEHDRGFQRFARLQGLLGEAEAFELREIGAGEVRLHVVGGDARASACRPCW